MVDVEAPGLFVEVGDGDGGDAGFRGWPISVERDGRDGAWLFMLGFALSYVRDWLVVSG